MIMNKQETVTVELEQDLLDKIKKKSKDDSISLDEYINDVLKNHIEEQEAK